MVVGSCSFVPSDGVQASSIPARKELRDRYIYGERMGRISRHSSTHVSKGM